MKNDYEFGEGGNFVILRVLELDNPSKCNQIEFNFFLIKFVTAIWFSFNVSFFIAGSVGTHSLSWHRKGDRNLNGRYFARIWRPEDPRSNIRNNQMHGSSFGL